MLRRSLTCEIAVNALGKQDNCKERPFPEEQNAAGSRLAHLSPISSLGSQFLLQISPTKHLTEEGSPHVALSRPMGPLQLHPCPARPKPSLIMLPSSLRQLGRGGRRGAWAQAARKATQVWGDASIVPQAAAHTVTTAPLQKPAEQPSSLQPRSLAPGEVHLWWLQPAKVG